MSGITSAIVLRHVAFEDLGAWSGLFGSTTMLDVGVDSLHDDADLLVVMGGPIGAYEDATYPFIRDELRLLERRLAANRPVLGVCLGAQMMAAALGAHVYAGGRKEIGWGPVRLSDAGRASCLRHLDGVSVLHWHGDTFELPRGAHLLARTEMYQNQAFSFGRHALAVQFHPEIDPARIEQWLIGHACELAAANVDVQALREQTKDVGWKVKAAGQAMVREWLAGLT